MLRARELARELLELNPAIARRTRALVEVGRHRDDPRRLDGPGARWVVRSRHMPQSGPEPTVLWLIAAGSGIALLVVIFYVGLMIVVTTSMGAFGLVRIPGL